MKYRHCDKCSRKTEHSDKNNCRICLPDRIKELLKKQGELVTEIQRAHQIKLCDYHAVKMPDTRHNFILVRLSDHKVVADGFPTRIRSYLNVRNIDTSKVFEYDQVEKILDIKRASSQSRRDYDKLFKDFIKKK